MIVKFWRSVARPTMLLYGSKWWVVDWEIEPSMSAVEMTMLRWTYGVMNEDRINNDCLKTRR